MRYAIVFENVIDHVGNIDSSCIGDNRGMQAPCGLSRDPTHNIPSRSETVELRGTLWYISILPSIITVKIVGFLHCLTISDVPSLSV